jgi:hypothetical protein
MSFNSIDKINNTLSIIKYINTEHIHYGKK